MADNLEKVLAQTLATHLVAKLPMLVLPPPAAPTVTPQGTPGATSYSYKVVSASRGGKLSSASLAGSTATGAASLGAANFNRITWAAVAGAEGYLVYRTVGGATQGLIARTAPGDTLQVDDTGLAGDGSVAPTTSAARIIVGAEDPDVPLDCSAVMILPSRMDFEPFLSGPEEVNQPADDQVIMDFGCWSGQFEIRAVSVDKPQRESIQRALHRAFIGADPTKTRRGVLVLTTPALTLENDAGDVITTYQAPLGYSLRSDSWDEEMVFDKKRWYSMLLDVSYPALVVWDDAYTIEEYHTALTHDFVSVDVADIPIADTLETDEFGNIKPSD